MGRTGRFYVSCVHWCCDGGRHLDRSQVIALRGAVIEGGLGCFVADGSSPAYRYTDRRLGCLVLLKRRGALIKRFRAFSEARSRGPSLWETSLRGARWRESVVGYSGSLLAVIAVHPAKRRRIVGEFPPRYEQKSIARRYRVCSRVGNQCRSCYGVSWSRSARCN